MLHTEFHGNRFSRSPVMPAQTHRHTDRHTDRQTKKNFKNVIFVFSTLNYTCWYDLFLKIENYKKFLAYRFIKIRSVSNWCNHSLKRYFSTSKWDRNAICVVFCSLNFLKPVHVRNVLHLLQYTPHNDVEQRDMPSRVLLMECKASIFELAKFDELWISRYLSHENIVSMTSLGIVQKPAWLHQHSRGTSPSSSPIIQHTLHRSIDFKVASDSCYCYPSWWWSAAARSCFNRVGPSIF